MRLKCERPYGCFGIQAKPCHSRATHAYLCTRSILSQRSPSRRQRAGRPQEVFYEGTTPLPRTFCWQVLFGKWTRSHPRLPEGSEEPIAGSGGTILQPSCLPARCCLRGCYCCCRGRGGRCWWCHLGSANRYTYSLLWTENARRPKARDLSQVRYVCAYKNSSAGD